MAYDRQSLLLTWLFGIIGTEETASFGVHVTGAANFPAGTVLAGMTDTIMDNLIGLAEDLMTSDNVAWAGYSELTGVKAAALGTDGHYIAQPKIRETSSQLKGTSGGIYPQLTVALSLRTGTTFGKAKWGRIFLPHLVMGLESGQPRASQAAAQGTADAGADFVTAVNGVFAGTGGANGVVTVMSKSGAGTSRAVTQVGCGRVIDTQRRRREQLIEAYSYSAV